MKDFDGVTGKISFDRNGDPTSKTIFLKAIENGNYVTLKRDISK
jgi:ABC-type branched-subunit amino acid transport system substrate-binding protein